MKVLFAPGLVAALSATSACLPLLDLDLDLRERPPVEDQEPEPVDDEAEDGLEDVPSDFPEVVRLALPEDRPVGPDDVVEIALADDAGLDGAWVAFRHQTWHAAVGQQDTIRASARDLGEGMGRLLITVVDDDEQETTYTWEDVVVDLSPPRIEPGALVVRPTGDGPESELSFWVGDAWVLGRVEVAFAGEVLALDFPAGWPSTLGESWDWSYVAFPGASLPEGAGEVEIRAWDAAGNAAVLTRELIVDGTPPLVDLVVVDDGASSGSILVDVTASDGGGGPVWIELRARGLSVGGAAGPGARIALARDDFAEGPLELVAVASDQAGNEAASEAAVVVVAR